MSLTGPFADKVIESTQSAPGTGTFSLGGAFGNGAITHVAGIGSGNIAVYFATDADGSNWERGYGTVTAGTPDTLTRTAVFASSNSGNKVNFTTAPTIFSSIASNVVNSLLSLHKDSSRPAWLPAGGMWIDETNDPTWTLKLWDGTDDISLVSFDVTNNTATVPIAAGGTGANTAALARTSLAVPGTGTVNTFTKTQTWAKGAALGDTDIAAGILTLGSDGNSFDFAGTEALTGIATVGVGTVVRLVHTSARTLTHDATDLILPGGANITTAAGDVSEWLEYAAGDWRCTNYQRATGKAVVSSAKLVQRVYFEDGTVATGTTLMVHDNSIPQSDEGNGFISGVTITPTSATNRLRITATLPLAHSAANANLVAALFKDDDTDALYVAVSSGNGVADQHVQVTMHFEMVAGTTSQIEFKIRVGSNTPGTTTINGDDSGTAVYGGVLKSTVIVEEITP